MKVLFTGKTDFKYNRVQVLLSGLKEIDDVEVELFPIKTRQTFDKNAFLEAEKSADCIYIPPFRHRDVSFIKKISKKPIVFDPLISKYLTKLDYGHFWKAPLKYYLDKIPFSKCDILIADTQHHKEYFIRKFKITESKVEVLPVGVNTELFFPQKESTQDSEVFKVGFYGSFVPLQGVPVIARTAHLLKDHQDIEFHIIGGGYEQAKVEKIKRELSLDNLKLLGWAAYEELNDLLNDFDVCLGIFGSSAKADMVVPNKVYHFAALKKYIITKDTPAIRDIFTPGQNIALCSNTPEEIAACILEAKSNPEKIRAVGSNAHAVIASGYSHIQIGQQFIRILERHL